MAEISEDAPPPPPPPPPPSPPLAAAAGVQGEAASTRRSTRPGRKRLFLTFSVLLSFLSGLPFFLKSTEIHRSPLPFESIDALSRRLQFDPPSLPCRFQAVFLRSGPDRTLAARLQSAIAADMGRRAGDRPSCGGCGRGFAVSVTVDSGEECVSDDGGVAGSCLWTCGAVSLDGSGEDDSAVDELLDSVLRGAGGKECVETGGGRVYTVVVMDKEDVEGVRVVVGKHRHAWVVGKVSEADAVSIISKVFVRYFMNGGKEGGGMEKGIGEFVPVGADGTVVLSFSLLNADPSDWVYDWEFQETSKIMLAPVAKALTPIANISIESQVLYHTPKSSNSYWDEKYGSYIFSLRDLPFFVRISTSQSAILLYVPSAIECPLLLQLPSGEISKTNGFISPMWGGIVIWNPPQCTGDSQKKNLEGSTLPPQELEKIFQVFIAQLRMLFGLRSNYIHSSETEISKFLDSERGFTEWELDVLFRHHACFNLHSCVNTLESLAKLVQSLPRMIVMDEIGKQVKYSLEAASLAQMNASLGIYDASAASSRKAKALAEDAFFHPSITSISYSSIEHYFAIYMPFFAPVSLHVLLAAIKELKRYKREKAKYMAFAADQARNS
ncbi:succinate dehydrogenase ubiquinone iron-sulfur subunit [Musa troglodytarum]|uniref:Succinate dehydrogenase ubiquinone iron-sulfur subunit n=1 Tax=Musa troglodytarum TaxID=320322 RepID=A0A9E7EH64_9LILI|nr:succinate dehydrogenase ubiquinone iron-sulfur subunit [Musa troglodytarum]URD77275.1 succinate dehydrogenase ubiquinone iron-sulfur subunit [Musa troglodytarum]URD77276.1 succinate dehydrogenase ubiquinone iron-sulfur subunit [Musa troglodytarum]